jgi:hypothetical protein
VTPGRHRNLLPEDDPRARADPLTVSSFGLLGARALPAGGVGRAGQRRCAITAMRRVDPITAAAARSPCERAIGRAAPSGRQSLSADRD